MNEIHTEFSEEDIEAQILGAGHLGDLEFLKTELNKKKDFTFQPEKINPVEEDPGFLALIRNDSLKVAQYINDDSTLRHLVETGKFPYLERILTNFKDGKPTEITPYFYMFRVEWISLRVKQVRPDFPDENLTPKRSSMIDCVNNSRLITVPTGEGNYEEIDFMEALYRQFAIDDPYYNRKRLLDGPQNARTAEIIEPLMALEHKIHLVPQEKYMPMLMARLLKAMEDPEWAKLIPSLKYMTQIPKPDELDSEAEWIKENNQMAKIVIYPALGKAAALEATRKILALFADCADQIGLDQPDEECTPRCSARLNSLISITQGSADFKLRYLYEMEDMLKKTTSGDEVTEQKLLTPDKTFFRNSKPTLLELLEGTSDKDVNELTREEMEVVKHLLASRGA